MIIYNNNNYNYIIISIIIIIIMLLRLTRVDDVRCFKLVRKKRLKVNVGEK